MSLPVSRIFSFLCFATLLFALSSCGKSYLYEERIDLPDAQWTYQDSLEYQFEVIDTNKLYNILVSLEHSPEFKTQNLYTRIATTFPDGNRLSKVVSLELADKVGFWYGDCNSETCVFEAPIQGNAYFNQQGQYTITLVQHMRKDSITGVQAIAIKLEDTGQTRQLQ